MKANTNLEQSKILAEFLPIESADMYWKNGVSDKFVQCFTPFVSDEYRSNVDYDYDIPCWSLAALLDVLPDSIYDNTYEFSQLEFTKKSVAYIHGTTDGIKIGALKDNLVDACVAMIEKLHEQKLL